MALIVPIDDSERFGADLHLPVFQKDTVGDKEVGSITEAFQKSFPDKKPEFVCVVPGRVNIIGEHVDYCGFPVFPMALDLSIMMAVCVEKGEGLHLNNFDTSYLPYVSDTLGCDFEKCMQSKPQWYHYFLCGLQGIQDYASQKGLVFPKMKLNVLVKGSIPPSAGLSSSSAMVCCSAMAITKAVGFEINKLDLAMLCAKCERYIGTQGGGMDQAICFLAESGKAKKIIFGFDDSIMAAVSYALPQGSVFVIANTLVQMNKAAGNQFNQRVVECKISAKLLQKTINADRQTAFRDVRKLVSVLTEHLPACDNHLSSKSLLLMLQLAEANLHSGTYSRAELLEALAMTEQDFISYCLTKNTESMQEFKLRNRAIHVFSESMRVAKFTELCSDSNDEPTLDNSSDIVNQKLSKLGQLMEESHWSCSQLYECSCSELDELVRICKKHGSLGSRLTGAGWGGCTVSLVTEDCLNKFMDGVINDYYKPRGLDHNGALFVTRAGSGAYIVSL